jgi:hypothetical protein
MSLLAVLFAVGPWKPTLPARLALYAWSLAAAAAIASNAVPDRIAHILRDPERHIGLGFSPLEGALTGAQLFLVLQLGIGVILQMMLGLIALIPFLFPMPGDPEAAEKFASGLITDYDADSRLSWTGFIMLLAQGAALAWARRQGSELRGELLGLAALAAVAHGAMNGDDAAGAAPVPSVDPLPELELSPEENRFFSDARASALEFLAAGRWLVVLGAAATILYVIVNASMLKSFINR